MVRLNRHREQEGGDIMHKVVTVEQAAQGIADDVTIAVGGTGPVLEANRVLEAIERRFLETAHPRGLSIFAPMLPGDRSGEGGLNCFAHEGMTRKVIGASFSAKRHPALLEMFRTDKIEGYMLGMGTAVQLLTAIGARKPGVFTKAGLGSFLDPRVEGGCANAVSRQPPVRLEQLDGQEYLYYPAFRVDVAIIRATTADENGYLSMEEEPNTLGMAELALAAKASGGKVIAQVKRLARAGSLDPRMVKVPGTLVDEIVVCPEQTQLSPQMADPAQGWNPFLAGALKTPYSQFPAMKLDAQKLVMRRAALELRRGDVVNLGAGVATQLPRVALEEGVLDDVVFTNEHGIFGGLMATASGGSFVPAYNADAIMDSAFQFNYYDGGGLDITFLGMGQVDAAGNINVSKFGSEWNASGGFNNIIEETPRLVFCGTFSSGGLRLRIDDKGMEIVQEGRHGKFVPQVEQITLNAARAFNKGQSVTYITERGVFALTAAGLTLVEIAPGVDLERDIRQQLAFDLAVSDRLTTMDLRIYQPGLMGLAL